jgi:O-antigen/teichoic acid export membrane protein
MGVLGILLSSLLTAAAMFLALTVPLFWRIGLRFDRAILAEMWSFGWPTIFGQLGGTIVHVSDRFFLKEYASIAEAGLYSLSYRFGTLPSQFISGPFNQTWLPRRFEIAKEEGSERVFGRIFTYYLTLISFVGLAVAVLSRDLLQLMANDKFWGAAEVIPVIVLANIIFTFHYHFNIGLLLEKKTRHLAVLNVSNAVLVLLLNWLLIPRYAAMGAAVATLIAFVAKSTATFLLGRRYYRTHFEGVRALKLLIVSALVFLATWWVEPPTPLLALLARGGMLLVLYPTLLLALKFFTADERAKGRAVIARRLGRRG